jgi:AcrR family transcriptional regulator
LRVGESLFSARPFDEVSIDDIATAAGISKNLIYHYFAGKRELFLAVIAHAAERLLAATAPDVTLPPADRLRASLEAHLDFALDHADGFVALMRGAGDEEVAAIIAGGRETVVGRTLESLPPRVARTPELEMALHGWIAMVDAAILRWVERRELPKERMLELLSALFLSVMGAVESVGAG